MPFVDPGPGGNKTLIAAALDLAGLSRVLPVGLGAGISDIQAPVLAAGDHGLDALVQMIQAPVSMAAAFGQGMSLQGTNALAIVLSGMTPLTAAALPSFEKIMAAHLGEVGGPWASAAILGLNGNNTPLGMAESVIALAKEAGIGKNLDAAAPRSIELASGPSLADIQNVLLAATNTPFFQKTWPYAKFLFGIGQLEVASFVLDWLDKATTNENAFFRSDDPVGEPDFWTGLIPFYGSGRSFINALQQGRNGAALVHGVFLVLDVFLITGAVRSLTLKGLTYITSRTAALTGGKAVVQAGGNAAASFSAKTVANVIGRGVKQLGVDLVSGFLNSPSLSRRALAALSREAKALGVLLRKNADHLLDSIGKKVRGAFDYETGEVLLRKGATFYEAFHEMTHARQWAALGKDAYKALGQYAREQHVFREIWKNRHLFSKDELRHAIKYMRKLRDEFILGNIT